jgi:hypothetical protein
LFGVTFIKIKKNDFILSHIIRSFIINKPLIRRRSRCCNEEKIEEESACPQEEDLKQE